jgi:hypothetical protein
VKSEESRDEEKSRPWVSSALYVRGIPAMYGQNKVMILNITKYADGMIIPLLSNYLNILMDLV